MSQLTVAMWRNMDLGEPTRRHMTTDNSFWYIWRKALTQTIDLKFYMLIFVINSTEIKINDT